MALPPFDAKTITGDELVKLVWTLKGELSPAHVAELQTRLAGRRLTFHGAWRSGASGSGGQMTEVGFKYDEWASRQMHRDGHGLNITGVLRRS